MKDLANAIAAAVLDEIERSGMVCKDRIASAIEKELLVRSAPERQRNTSPPIFGHFKVSGNRLVFVSEYNMRVLSMVDAARRSAFDESMFVGRQELVRRADQEFENLLKVSTLSREAVLKRLPRHDESDEKATDKPDQIS